MADVTVTVSDFKSLFDRGQFTYGEIAPDVRDKDITEAISEMEAVYNSDLVSDENICTKARLYLAAHYLVLDLENENSGGQPVYQQISRSADGLSETVHLPTWLRQGDAAFYATTSYGQKFLSLIKPYIDGAVYSVSGATGL